MNALRFNAALAIPALALALVAGGCGALDRSAGLNRDKQLKTRNGQPAPVMGGSGRGGTMGSLDRGKILQDQGLKDQALAAFERAIAENPQLVPAYMAAGDLYREKGDHSMAQKRYEAASILDPTNFLAEYGNALMLQLLNRIDEAISAYLRALTLNPDDFNANLNLATAYLQRQEPTQAVIYGEKAVAIDGRSAPARINLGAVYSALGRHGEAVTEYQQASELTELSPELLLNLANSLGQTKRYDEMLNTLDQLVKLHPSAIAYERRGSALFSMRRYDESLASFRDAIKVDQDHYPAWNGVAVCMLNQWVWSKYDDEEAHQEALKALRRSLSIERNQPKIAELVATYQ